MSFSLGQKEMMRLFAIVMVLALTSLAGCRKTAAHSSHRDAWRGFSRPEARQYLENIRNVFLVCITEDHVEDLHPGRPSSWSVLCFQGTVVRRYKGDWSVGERIKFTHALDGTVEKQSNTCVGELMFVLTDVHTNKEFGVLTGEFERYRPETDRLLTSLLPEKMKD